MSLISIAGTLILDGDINTTGEVRLETTGQLIPVATKLLDPIYSCPNKDFIFQNGKTPTITSTTSNIQILGTINGIGEGFSPNSGPGANSSLMDSQDDPSDIYGATHAGYGAVFSVPGTIELIEEEFIIHAVNIAQGGVDLSYAPLSGLAVNIIHGSSQNQGTDFSLKGDFLSWEGLALEYLLTVGDIIRVVYLANTARYFQSPRNTYGSYEAPTSVGSGSGEVSGGSGLKLVARNGTINLNGSINISGENGSSNRSGGGSGGSFWAQAYELSGSGEIISEGGDASYAYAGGGGGGYVTLNYEKLNSFQGSVSVAGHKGGTHGITTIKKIEPFFTDKFTGSILNSKWWTIKQNPITVNNALLMDTSTGDIRNPRLESNFQISGKNIQVDCDFIPTGLEPSYHTSYFQLYIDDLNWVQVARKHNNIFGMYTINGDLYQTAIPYDYTNTTFRIVKTDATYSFQIVDSSAGPVSIMTEYLPQFENANFKVGLGTQKDDPDSSNYVTDYFKLTNVDEADGFVTLAGIPVGVSNVALNVINGGPQIYGVDYTVSGQRLYWIPPNLTLQEDDEILASYTNDTTFNALNIAWDNFDVYSGILRNIETSELTLYVDPVNGSDSSDGRILTPVKNLFVATAWAKKGSTVVLYDGTYNPTEIVNKSLTIQGAYGGNALITTENVQDSTGSNWENSCLTFRNCQGFVKNVQFRHAQDAIYAQNVQEFQVNNCIFHDITTAVKLVEYNKNCSMIGNVVHDASGGFTFENQSYSPYIYSNVVYDSSIAVQLIDASNYIVSSNTFDTLNIGVLTDRSSHGVVASNNITTSSVAVYLEGDTSASLINNNFFGTTSVNLGSGTVTDNSNNVFSSPAYANQFLKNFHILSFSADRSTGTDVFDKYFADRDGARRLASPGYDIGAYQFIDAPHVPGSYYVDSSGDDYLNTGNLNSPFRTLDKAMTVADSSVFMGDGHYNSQYLKFKEQNIYYVDASKQAQTFTLDTCYSNIEFGSLLFVSSSGSDGTVLGGDGTNSGGDGSIQRPFRTVARALAASSQGDCIVALSGEYPLFNGKLNRTVVPAGDRTDNPDGRMYFEDLFSTPAAMFPGHNIAEPLSWDLNAQTLSNAFIQEGYLSMSYDGLHTVSATSLFSFTPNSSDTTAFEVSAELRQAFDPICFSAFNGDNTATIELFNGDYTCSLYTNGTSHSNSGHLHVSTPIEDQYFTDYICVSSEDVQNKALSLTYLLEDTTNVAVDVVGGVTQETGIDFYIKDNKIAWDGLVLDGEISAGDILRVIYKARGLSDPVRVRFVLKDNTITIMAVDQGYYTSLMKRALYSDPTGAWKASFYMDRPVHTNNEISRGYASKFLAIAEVINDTDKAKSYENKIWRQPIVIYNS